MTISYRFSFGLILCNSVRSNNDIRFLFDKCFVHIRNGVYFGKARELNTIGDFSVYMLNKMGKTDYDIREYLGNHMLFPFAFLKKHHCPDYSNFFYHHPTRYIKTGMSFFYHGENLPDDGDRPTKALMLSIEMNPTGHAVYIISEILKYGLEDNRELWREENTLYSVVSPLAGKAEGIEYLINIRKKIADFTLKYIEKTISVKQLSSS